MDVEKQKEEWFKRRRLVAWFGLVQQALVYFEYSAVSISAMYYYKNTMGVTNPRFLYGFSMAVTYISIILSVILFGNYMDKTRNLRRIVFISISCSILGNILYTMSFNAWVTVFGRFLCGINEGGRVALTGEISRIYNREELGKIFSMWQIVGAVCLSLAPCTPLLFLGIKFEIIHNTWIINQNNFVGLFLAISFILMWIAACFCISNLTLDPIYQQIKCEILEKAHENVTFAKDEEKQKDLENISDDILITHKLWTLKNVLKRADVFLVLFSSAILMGQYFQAEVLINMISLYHFNFTMSKLAFATV
ncbi:uncharacterized protein [Clytia hemisphaerica]|uniref:Major facilitator superfamily (MFS) profile domain-containing protein n=1 Tax=Clytia hemisphaerica TaxID=252671 RepID=A0A7M5UM62_9CNID